MKKKLPEYKDRVWEALTTLHVLVKSVEEMNRTEARQFRDALLRVYGSQHQGIDDEGYEVPVIPHEFFDSYTDWRLHHVDLIEDGLAGLFETCHPSAGKVSGEEVEIEIGWKKREKARG